MNKNLTLLAVASFLFCITLKAQDNVVKLNLGGLLATKVSLNYERVVNEKQSFSIYFDLRIPKTLNTIYFPIENSEGEKVGIKRTGFSVSPEYRFYTSSKKDAPRGFYVAPYLKYSQTKYTGGGYINIQQSGTDDPTTYKGDVDAFVNCFGGGVQIGYQWLINDKISIDWSFFGLGIDRNVIGVDIIPDDKSTNLEQMANDIEREAGEFPVIGKKIKADAKDDKVVVKLPFLFPNLRGAISIGYAF